VIGVPSGHERIAVHAAGKTVAVTASALVKVRLIVKH
jgi:hypothetical protein